MKTIPKGWSKTPYEKAEIWGKLKNAAMNLDFAAGGQRLDQINMFLDEIQRYATQLEKAGIADALKKEEKDYAKGK